MSDRVGTEAVRRQVAAGVWTVDNPLEVAIQAKPIGSDTILALCDELDRTREALRTTADTLHDLWRCNDDAERRQLADRVVRGMAFGAHPSNWPVLAESGNTEPKVCPTCGSRDPRRHNSVSTGTRWVECPDSWHRTTDTEGDKP